MASRFKAPWSAAIVLLVLVWSIYFIGPRGYLQNDDAISVEQTDVIFEGVAQPNAANGAGHPLAAPAANQAPKAPAVAPGKSDPSKEGLNRISDTDGKANPADPQNLGHTTASSGVLPQAAPKAPLPVVKTPTKADLIPSTDRPLVTYVYSQTVSAEANLRFFVAHALNSAADFIFIINGEAAQALEIIPEEKNINIVKRPNDCYDLGSHAEILTTKVDKNGKKSKKGVERWTLYRKFILLNASVRGPFMPNWSNGCWMDAYLGKLSDEVKLVGMTANCWPQFHVQSMIWATDQAGVNLLLYPPQPAIIPEGLPADWKEVGINGCFHTWDEAVHAEVFSTSIIRNAGYQIAVMMSAFYSDADYVEHCDSGGNGDVLWNGKYFGTNVHPYETIFMKTNRDIDPVLIGKLTSWKDAENYTSYDRC